MVNRISDIKPLKITTSGIVNQSFSFKFSGEGNKIHDIKFEGVYTHYQFWDVNNMPQFEDSDGITYSTYVPITSGIVSIGGSIKTTGTTTPVAAGTYTRDLKITWVDGYSETIQLVVYVTEDPTTNYTFQDPGDNSAKLNIRWFYNTLNSVIEEKEAAAPSPTPAITTLESIPAPPPPSISYIDIKIPKGSGTHIRGRLIQSNSATWYQPDTYEWQKTVYSVPAVGLQPLTPLDETTKRPKPEDIITFQAPGPITATIEYNLPPIVKQQVPENKNLKIEIIYDTINQSYSSGYLKITGLGAPESEGPQLGSFQLKLVVSNPNATTVTKYINYQTEWTPVVPMNTEDTSATGDFYVTPYVIDFGVPRPGYWDVKTYSFKAYAEVQVHDGIQLRPDAVTYTVNEPSYKEGYITMRVGSNLGAKGNIDFTKSLTNYRDTNLPTYKYIEHRGWTISCGGKMLKMPINYRVESGTYYKKPAPTLPPNPGTGNLSLKLSNSPTVYVKNGQTVSPSTYGGWYNLSFTVSGWDGNEDVTLYNNSDFVYNSLQWYDSWKLSMPYTGQAVVGGTATNSDNPPKTYGSTWTGYIYKSTDIPGDSASTGSGLPAGTYYYAVLVFGPNTRTAQAERASFVIANNPSYPVSTPQDTLNAAWDDSKEFAATIPTSETPKTSDHVQTPNSALYSLGASSNISSSAPVYTPPPPPPPQSVAPPPVGSSGVPSSPIPDTPPVVPPLPDGFISDDDIYNRALGFYNQIESFIPSSSFGLYKSARLRLATCINGVLHEVASNKRNQYLLKISNTLDFINSIHDVLTNKHVENIRSAYVKMEDHQRKLRELGEDPGIHVIGPYELFSMIAVYKILIEEAMLARNDELADPATIAAALKKIEPLMEKVRQYKEW